MSRRKLLTLIVLVTNGFVWFFLSTIVLSNATQSLGDYGKLLNVVINTLATALAAIVGAIFPRKSSRVSFLKIWMITGTLVSLAPLILDMTNFSHAAFVALIWGLALGFGMPLSMEFFAEFTNVENRGRVGAILFFFTFIGIFVLGTSLQLIDVKAQMITLAAWRFFGLISFIFLSPSEIPPKRGMPLYRNIIQDRSFLLYFSAWLMFALVNYLNIPIADKYFVEEFTGIYITLIAAPIQAFFALLAGSLCDTLGRKRIIISGFVLLGLGYAALGVFPKSFVVWYFYTIVDGVAWGLLGVVFFMVIWGDIAYEMASRKYFALGSLPLLFSNLLQRLVGPDLVEQAVDSITVVFSLASFFLFLAVLPLLYAPETLPRKKIEERQIKKYVEEAKKIVEKEAEKKKN
ncbi:MAG: MFS transporter [Candidatus Bathyarchaeia archaeon]|jgi:MFS family permease|nr:hypothetical protein [Candidatus Bathyarchaeota archaeon A05DMB-4]MDH7595957.1 hypothetical protein [Candidatus Bathyarchaeota archaeon]